MLGSPERDSPDKTDFVGPTAIAWYLARGSRAEEAKALAQTIEKEDDRYEFVTYFAGGQVASGDWDGASAIFSQILVDRDLFINGSDPRWIFHYLHALADEHARAQELVASLEDTDHRIHALAASAVGRAAVGDLTGTNEYVARAHEVMKRHGWLGLEADRLSAEGALEKGFSDGEGSYVTSLALEGPAWEAGLRRGDKLVSFNGIAIDDKIGIDEKASALPAGTQITLRILRKGVEKQITVSLGRGGTYNSSIIFAEAFLQSARMVALAKAGEIAAVLRLSAETKPVEVRAIALLSFGAAMDLLEDETAKQAALDSAMRISFSDSSLWKSLFGNNEFRIYPPLAMMDSKAVQLPDQMSNGGVSSVVFQTRMIGAALAGKLSRLPDDMYQEFAEFSLWEGRPDMEIWRAEFLARAGDGATARIAAKAITNVRDRKMVREQVALMQAAAGKLEVARATTLLIHGKKQDDERDKKTAAHAAFLTRLDRIAKGWEQPPPVRGAFSPLPLEAAKAVADPYRRARILLANAAEQRVAGDEDAAAQALALAREAAEAEDVPFYCAMAFIALAEGHLNVGDRGQVAADLKTALAVYATPSEE